MMHRAAVQLVAPQNSHWPELSTTMALAPNSLCLVDSFRNSSYAEQMLVDHPELDRTILLADAAVAVAAFHDRLHSST